MTQLPAALPTQQQPASIALAKMAIAAGLAGHGLNLCFDGFDAPVLCEMWKSLTGHFPTNAVFHVHTQADVKKVAERIGELRLVVPHSPRLHNPTSWAIQMVAGASGGTNPLPAMFSYLPPKDLDDDPGATLVLRGDGRESDSLSRWLALSRDIPGTLPYVTTSGSVRNVDPQLRQALNSNSAWHCRFRERRVLDGLVAGAATLRSARQNGISEDDLFITMADYNRVRRLLCTSLTASPDLDYDPMAADMVARANTFLAIKYGPDRSERNPFRLVEDVGNQMQIDPVPRPLVTRREIADLGNVRSGIVRRLIEYLKGEVSGYDLFSRMGLIRRSPEYRQWNQMSAKQLSAFLRPWSIKQVRTHFDRLCQAGLISATRESGNGPWRYELPEELMTSLSAFQRLPDLSRQSD